MKIAIWVFLILVAVVMYACCSMAGQYDDWEGKR